MAHSFLLMSLRWEWDETASFFGNLCYHTDVLGVQQRAPHVDNGFVKHSNQPIQIAMVHYLSSTRPMEDAATTASRTSVHAYDEDNDDDSSSSIFGGTAFYMETASQASRFRPLDCHHLHQHLTKEQGVVKNSRDYRTRMGCYCATATTSSPTGGQEEEDTIEQCFRVVSSFTNNRTSVIPSGYYYVEDDSAPDDDKNYSYRPYNKEDVTNPIGEETIQNSTTSTAESSLFELLLHIPYQFDRVVVYSGKQLHTAHVPDPSILSCDPRHGRLTANLFLI